MRKLNNHSCHLMCLTLALGGLTSGAALMFGYTATLLRKSASPVRNF